MQTSGRLGKGLAVLATCTLPLIAALALSTAATGASAMSSKSQPPQETGFLNRTVIVQGIPYKFQVYIPESYVRPASPPGQSAFGRISGRPHDENPDLKSQRMPVILFLHGRGERGSEGMWQTQIGLPSQIRDHPERWPFIVVMPQCPLRHFWTDPDMLHMAMAALEQEEKELQTDPDRVYLVALSLGGYGAWELARLFPRRWAAAAIAASGIFWSYAPDRWREVSTLPAEYARRIGRLPIWLFHGTDDPVVVPRQSELMFEALKANNGHVRLWDYQGLRHDCWARAFNEPELPRWLLAHRVSQLPQMNAYAERIIVPLHPVAVKLPPAVLDSYVGEYHDSNNVLVATIQRQGEQMYLHNPQGDASEIQPESTTTFFYPTGSLTRLIFEHDREGHVTGILYRDDRHEEHWDKRK